MGRGKKNPMASDDAMGLGILVILAHNQETNLPYIGRQLYTFLRTKILLLPFVILLVMFIASFPDFLTALKYSGISSSCQPYFE